MLGQDQTAQNVLYSEEMLGQEPKCTPHTNDLSIKTKKVTSLELTCYNIEYATCAVQVLSMASVSGVGQ